MKSTLRREDNNLMLLKWNWNLQGMREGEETLETAFAESFFTTNLPSKNPLKTRIIFKIAKTSVSFNLKKANIFLRT